MAHTVSVHQLHSLLRINSFSCLQIAPRIDWFYLPAFLGRAWKREKSVAPRLPSHLFIVSSPCFNPLSLFIFLSSLPCTCTSSGRLLPPTSLQRNPNPCSRVSVQGLFRGAGWAGGGSLPEYQALQLPDSSGSITGSLESRKNPPVVILWYLVSLRNFRLSLFVSVLFYLLIE